MIDASPLEPPVRRLARCCWSSPLVTLVASLEPHVTGAAGTDTSLPTTDSAVTVTGAGRSPT